MQQGPHPVSCTAVRYVTRAAMRPVTSLIGQACGQAPDHLLVSAPRYVTRVVSGDVTPRARAPERCGAGSHFFISLLLLLLSLTPVGRC